jgi:hypothetical protein
MKNLFRSNVVITVCLLATACGQTSQTAPPPFPSPNNAIIELPTVTPMPRETTTATIQYRETPYTAPTLEPTFLPTIEPTLIPDLLKSGFTVEVFAETNGHNIRRITGWIYGFRPSRYCFGPYKWLNQSHLLLFPLVGQEYGMGITQLSLPTVINHESGKAWLPLDDLFSLSSCQQPLWSNILNVVIATQGRETIIFSPEGDIINRYPGINASLSPSGTKLVTGGVWIDLISGKQVDFSSQGIDAFSTWSSDENELYSCCYAYGNIRTGKGYTFELGGLRYVGRDYGDGFTGIKNMWVMNDTYVITYWDFQNDTELDIFPLIEPSTQTYKDLQKLTDIPDDSSCRLGSVAPDKKKIWVNCYKPNNYLVNLETFAVSAYSGDLNLISWSSNGDFAWLRTFNNNPPQILSVSGNQQLQALPIPAQIETAFWHPIENILAYLSEQKQTLIIIDPQTMSFKELALPSNFRSLVWSPKGEHIALLAEDGGLWQVDFPILDNLEQLMSPLPGIRDIQWSPDGNYIAFVGGTDIYIVDTIK